MLGKSSRQAGFGRNDGRSALQAPHPEGKLHGRYSGALDRPKIVYATPSFLCSAVLWRYMAMDAAAVAAIVMVKLLFVVKAFLALSAAIALEKVLHIVRHAVRFERRTRSGHSISAVVAPLGS